MVPALSTCSTHIRRIAWSTSTAARPVGRVEKSNLTKPMWSLLPASSLTSTFLSEPLFSLGLSVLMYESSATCKVSA
jgi:hypothetical protein